MTNTDSLIRQGGHDTQPVDAGEGTNTASTSDLSNSTVLASAREDSPNGQAHPDIQRKGAVGGQDTATTNAFALSKDVSSLPSELPDDHRRGDIHGSIVVGDSGPTSPAIAEAEPTQDSPVLVDPTLALLADVLDDLERTRIANENRLRALTRSAEDKDGELRGFGLDESHPDVARLAGLVEGLGKLEHEATLNLQRAIRRSPFGPWIKATKGVGEKQAARLLAAIGDPYWNALHDRPRTVSELWAFSGLHVVPTRHAGFDSQRTGAGGDQAGDPDHSANDVQGSFVGVAAKRRRGQKANWSNTAKMRTFVIAESCVKQLTSPYRKVYDEGRAKYTDAVHAVECERCGPSGKPAQPGSALSAGHQHARALRLVMKAVLKDLWREAKRLHETGSGHSRHDSHGVPAAAPNSGDGHTPSDTQPFRAIAASNSSGPYAEPPETP